MAYRLKPSHPARNELRRIASDQLESAARTLRDADAAQHAQAVHTARKALKKTRALLRLARPGLPRAAYRAQMDAMRETGRLLSGARDAAVLADTLDDLAEPASGRIPARPLRDLRRDVRKLAAATFADDAVEQAAARLEELAAGVANWPLDDLTWSAVRKGATHSYARGRGEFRRARRSSDPELLHEWRKRVKDHWYHGRLLRNTWKPVMRASADEADRLGELLGDDHDLATLGRFLDDHRDRLAGRHHHDEVLQLIEERRSTLQAHAVALGERIYAERPKAYGKRIGCYLKSVRSARPRSSPATA